MGYQPLAQEPTSSSTCRGPSGPEEPESEAIHNLSNQDSVAKRDVQAKENPPVNQDGEPASTPPPRRRFLPQPVETSSRSSAPQSSSTLTDKHIPESSMASVPSPENKNQNESRPRGRILPQPIETITTSRPGASRSQPPQAQKQKQKPPSTTPSPRRFTPNLIETDTRSVKGKSVGPSSSIESRELSVESNDPSARLSSPRRNTSPHLSDSKFSYVSLLRRQETRRHSFRVPSLPRIPSVSSEDSEDTSAISLPSSPPAQLSQKAKDANPNILTQQICDGDLSEYLLSVAAQSAQKELKEQTLAAFPNEQVYEPVDHFAIDEEDGDSEDQDSVYPKAYHLKSRRQSSADLSWELDYMRQHKEEAEQRLRVMVTSNARKRTPNDHVPVSKPHGPSPPMLGADIVLPWSTSPDGTLCENTNAENGAQPGENPCTDCGGLWCAASQGDGGRGAGLWMGTCQKTEGPELEPHVITGLMTPRIQDPEFEFSNNNGLNAHLSPTGKSKSLSSPQPSTSTNTNPNLDLSKVTSDEFNDSFVTQIYNYVSLGYPCVARYYDHELSRISGIAVDELRQDDLHTDAKGYVVAPEDEQAVPCMRWKALRLYIREWARQSPTMAEDETGFDAWGVPERRGSWAI